MSKQYKLVRCTINGKQVEKMIDVRASLTDMLRDDYRLTSVKKGCEVGECGACNVLVNGECFNSCIYLAVWADGKEILTLEGLRRSWSRAGSTPTTRSASSCRATCAGAPDMRISSGR